MSYRDKLTALGDIGEKRVLAVYARYVAGEISRDDAVAVMATLIAKSNSTAVALADLSLASSLMIELGEPVATTGSLRPAGELDRLAKASNTVLDVAEASPVPEAIIARLARAEAYEAAARAFSEGIAKNKRVRGWVRDMEPGACELCVWWWRQGREWPAIHPFQTHKGCLCAPRVVVSANVTETGYSRKVEAAEQHAAARKAKRSTN